MGRHNFYLSLDELPIFISWFLDPKMRIFCFASCTNQNSFYSPLENILRKLILKRIELIKFISFNSNVYLHKKYKDTL